MSAPTLVVSFGFGSTWTTADGSITWDDETAYVIQESVSVSRGRSSELDDFRAGTARLTLRNEDRRFDPLHAAGAHYGDLKAGVPIRIQAVANGSTIAVFRGFVDAWPQAYMLGNTMSVVDISATDGFAKLAQAGLPSSVYAYEVSSDSPSHWWRLSETAGTVMGDSSSSGFDGDYTAGTTDLSVDHPNPYETVKALDLDNDDHGGEVVDPAARITALPFALDFIAKVETADAGGLVVSQGDTATGERWWASLTTPALGAILEAGNDVDAVSEMLSDDSGGATATAAHHYAVRFISASPYIVLYVDGVEVSSTLAGTPIFEGKTRLHVARAGQLSYSSPVPFDGFGGVLADVAIYDAGLTAARVAAHADAFLAPWDGDDTGARIGNILDAVGWPSGLRSLATGQTTLGPATLGGKALERIKKAEAAEQGRFFISRAGAATFLNRYYNLLVTQGNTAQATFSDDGSDIPYSALAFDDGAQMVKNRVRASRPGGAEIEVSDATSITNYGDQEDSSLTGIDFENDEQARNAAEYRLARYKDTTTRVKGFTVHLHGLTAAQQATVLGLELGYRVNVERTPQGVGSAIDTDEIIESISHSLGPGAWDVSFQFSPVDTKRFFILDTSTLDGSDVLGY